MKKSILSFVLVATTSIFYAQSTLDKYDGMDDVNTILVNKKMFELMSKVHADSNDAQMQNYLNLTKKIDDLKVFSTTNPNVGQEMKITAENYIKTTNLNQLKQIKEGNKIATVYTDSGATNAQVKELFMFVNSPENGESVLMDVKGNFNLNEIGLLIDKMQIPGGAYLKQATGQP
ncbi:DUF4252 domain-containing protein [Flavobacterium agrisoli]|uniref:DUF4252 domain-containing protein n=1 Tax=Flavobacterium agrisoli TaxID=2793066 RepID=A0A934PR89_9FLAO|nr:DUF4252 domain-containing protein [Flavobacterium agrisoli]MBK0371203.1 DUF4252 domain-containing protein [Flavobacterium agrisoli]